MSPRKIIIDTDPGIDDAMAIFFACLHPGLDVVGLTSVFGNVTVEVATRNALVLTEMAQQDIPVAMGEGQPLVQVPNDVSAHIHGNEGFGDMQAIQPNGAAVSESGPEFICRTIDENPGEIVLCPIGPLTNIARALEQDPGIASKVDSVVIMGGGLERGNVTGFAEANIWNDPHAADAVFAADWDITMVGLDVTNQVVCDDADFARIAGAAPTLGGFLNRVVQFYLQFYEQRYGIPGCQMHDPTAVIAITHPELFIIETHALEVIVDGAQVGQTVRSAQAARRPAKVCMGVDAERVKELFLSTIETGF
ncbi:MAG: nucleoside hydrolase [Rhodobacteraceae bacterium]|nr:nucleoside hydrolase [Paracoccaceae bacterium]